MCIVTHLLLKNHVQWLKNDSEHCSAATKKHPVTNILDGNCMYDFFNFFPFIYIS